MRKFVLRRRKRWVARAFGRNLLLRWTDRVEACVILAAMLLALGVCATWPCAAGGARGGELHIERAEWVTTDRTVTDGDQIHLWLNDAGTQVDPPTPLTQAGVDAIGAGAGIGGCAILGLIAGVALVRSRLDRIRRAQLEREIDRFASGDTTNHSQ